MFKNIGDKIKTLTIIVTVTGMIFSLISGTLFIMSDIFKEFAYRLICGILIIIAGALIFWISGFTMYGFGELIDRTASIDKKLSELLRRSNPSKKRVNPDPYNENQYFANNDQQ